MNPELFNELRKLRNEIAHGIKRLDSPDVAKHLEKIGISIPTSELPSLIPALMEVLGVHGGIYFVPQIVVQAIAALVEGRSARLVCDPWAGLGVVSATLKDATKATRTLAFTPNEREASLGKALVKNIEWKIGDPLNLLSELPEKVDVMASVLPFGARRDNPITLKTKSGSDVELRDDWGGLILAAAAQKLDPTGVGLFVIPPSFFFSQRSVLRCFDALGIGIQGAFALPSGTFAPYTNIQSYLVVVRKQPSSRMFVAQLSVDAKTNLQIVSNFKNGREGGRLELGRYVEVETFTGLDSIRTAEKFQQAERQFGAAALRLEEFATAIHLGRFGDGFEFPRHDNAIFVPTIGISDVVDSLDDLTLKKQNYAQIVIDPAKSDARFVARFLNSEFGKEIREMNKAGAVIPKLNKKSLAELRIFVPPLATQRSMLELEARITTEHNTLLGLQNEISELRRELWNNPQSSKSVEKRLSALSSRLSTGLKQHAGERLEEWSETLPFPLASILRAWRATPAQDFKSKHEHLLHFFEATAEFFSVILLSAYKSHEEVFEQHKQKLKEAMDEQKLSFQRATFGTWKLVVEYLGKQTRLLLSDGEANQEAKNGRSLCSEIFSDTSLVLPEALARKELASIISTTNKMRNDWGGHSGVVGQDEAKLRNELLVSELQKLREVIGDAWAETQMIQLVRGDLHRGQWENEVALLMGSNSEFLKEPRLMSMPLEKDGLYLARKDEGKALRLLPLIKVDSSPQSAKNACYFFSRLEKDGARFISYHFADKPELKGSFEEATEAIRFLTSI